ncbi:bifunctional 23S rRNA (guanine(2069)-N(7))-methyltransferase RlmK/23S rRNA (guanine(2445)-N(2))-methyltransferase RlmL [Spongiibacter sp. KMU-158]|uniref:Ribosomal RNA large subunit methyltransferase K/L n=1 Tax=Spongiibacter pelagi TaxID=2760804 RepID=A0A927C3X5_9GAMM|nr:bifunctional 23S rRNA (guanine(2069)-N(7))-methyltransferase RlmK/23S rRNA (guanine(2445)-N(2))-methyltransferase RlmL [Spongiibacter pelagi]MBD2859136.1 bifunctional 23S rRNA (guanine(2069)-N(7))-methyltransferase RlmK/23S rRNA (guanine(2445)-N(2))-methyltransferase RlmL [Spongiibacter pelagi]
MSHKLPIILSCPKGLESLLIAEAESLGAELVKESVGSLRMDADLQTIYRLCLWSRLANRVMLQLHEWQGDTADSLYQGLLEIEWSKHLAAGGSLCIDFNGRSGDLRNSHFAALRAKDAVVDYFQNRGQARPSIEKQNPDLRLNVRLKKGRFLAALDLSGESLHRRGYRHESGLAPLKENLAAAILLRADWPSIASRGGALIDPMCGSGTLLIEGALMAMNIAPGLKHGHWGFSGWLGHNAKLWQMLFTDAENQRNVAMQRQWPEIRGYDASGKIIAQAEANIGRAGLEKVVRVSRRELSELTVPSHRDIQPGLLVCNPPYGERLGDEAELVYLYQSLGQRLRDHFLHWQAAVFTGNPQLGKRMGLRSHKHYQFVNASIPTRLLLFKVEPDQFVVERSTAPNAENMGQTGETEAAVGKLSAGAEMFANRLKKNIKRLEKWRRRENIECYRVYDADMPEYAVAVDCYGEAIHISEYAAPASVDEDAAKTRLRDVIQVCSQVFNQPIRNIAIKERRRQRGTEQYQRQGGKPSYQQKNADEGFMQVSEGQAKLLVNLFDYLDTGLFLDHRPVRLDIAARAKGKRFLNLFSYTAVASVQAGLGGARHTTSVDMSHTYLRWARRNLSLNGLSESRHRTEQADCRRWLAECKEEYDLILLDPPTFSNSKRMDDVLDTQRDHGGLIREAMRCLAKDGLLIFSTNKRGFILDEAIASNFDVQDKTQWSLDEDFKRRSKPIHYCWYIRHRDGAGK